jgi:Sap, sulfolipid-1-addressing protein
MIEQAAGLALLAAISPTALLVAAVFLGSAKPRLTATFYLLGAVLTSVIMGVVVLAILRSAGLSLRSEHTPRYGLRLGLGVLLTAAGLWVAKRSRQSPSPGPPRQGFMSRLISNPAPRSAFIAGALVFAPGASFVAAIQVIATARAGLALTGGALALVVVINVLLVWLPLVLYLLAPRTTTRHLGAFNTWLRAHGRTVLATVLGAIGAIMVSNGIYGLVGG